MPPLRVAGSMGGGTIVGEEGAGNRGKVRGSENGGEGGFGCLDQTKEQGLQS